MADESLKNKTIKGTVWSAADAFLGQGVTFLVGIVLARLLSPDEYGLIGICLIFNTVLNGIVDSGFSNALIRKNNCTEDDFNTMFITNMFFSLGLYLMLYIFSPNISVFFSRNDLTPIIRVTGLLLICNALCITHLTILTKRIDFKTKTKASLSCAIISGGIGICMAYMGCGVWSLVAQMISKQLVYALTLWVLVKWYPTFRFSWSSFHYMWGFGWKLMLSGLLNNIWNQLYQVVVGKFYSPATLGQYSRSRQFANLFSENFTSIIQRVSYPALANIQNDKDRMVAAYRKVIKMTMFVTVTVLFALGASAEPFIYCLIGPKWNEAASFLPLICITLTLYPLHAINLNMLQILGRSDIFLYLEIIKKIIALIPIGLGIFVGIYWMLVGSIFTGLISFFLNSWYTGKKLHYNSWMQLKDVSSAYGIATLLATCIFFIKFLPISYWIVLALQFLVGLAVLLSIGEIAKPKEYVEIKSIIMSYIHKK